MRLSIIHHIAIIVSDYEKSKDLFYGKRFTFFADPDALPSGLPE